MLECHITNTWHHDTALPLAESLLMLQSLAVPGAGEPSTAASVGKRQQGSLSDASDAHHLGLFSVESEPQQTQPASVGNHRGQGLNH